MVETDLFPLILMGVIMGLDLLSRVPQIIHLARVKKTIGFSINAHILWILSATVYLVYCIVLRYNFLMIETSITLMLNIIILILSIKYSKKRRKK